jgi:hypothetical protein
MSKLDGRVNKLERTDQSREVHREQMSEQDRQILEQLAAVELSVCPDLALVTEADTDPQTFREIQRTMAEARGEFEAEPSAEAPSNAKPAPRPSAPRMRRPGRHREEDLGAMMEALAFIDHAIAESGDAATRVDQAIEAARKRTARNADAP